MTNPWERADELDTVRHAIYQRLKKAIEQDVADDIRVRLEDDLYNAMRDQAEEIERVVKSRRGAVSKPHPGFKPTGGKVANAYQPAIVGEVHECVGGCGARVILWPDGRTTPVTQPFPLNCN